MFMEESGDISRYGPELGCLYPLHPTWLFTRWQLLKRPHIVFCRLLTTPVMWANFVTVIISKCWHTVITGYWFVNILLQFQFYHIPMTVLTEWFKFKYIWFDRKNSITVIFREIFCFVREWFCMKFLIG